MKNQQNTELSNNKSVNSICSLEKSIQIPVLDYDTKSYNMTSERIRQIQEYTAYPDRLSVKQALLKVWNDCKQEQAKMYSEEEIKEAFRQGQDNMEYSEIFRWDYKLTEKQWFEQFKKK